jgi:hypothetical protein
LKPLSLIGLESPKKRLNAYYFLEKHLRFSNINGITNYTKYKKNFQLSKHESIGQNFVSIDLVDEAPNLNNNIYVTSTKTSFTRFIYHLKSTSNENLTLPKSKRVLLNLGGAM